MGARRSARAPTAGYAVKVLWAADPSYAGPVLVRGRRIDGDGVIRFTRDGTLSGADKLALDPSTSENVERAWPSYTPVQSPGCYAYQIDGTTFNYTVVFEIVR
jgi:hypothetical protein